MAVVEERWVSRLEKAISARDEDLVACLLSEPEAKDGVTMSSGPARGFPLYWAVKSGSFTILCAVLRAGGDVEQYTAKDWTALHCAADTNQVRMAAKLLKASGADVDIFTDQLETPLHLATSRGHLDMARLLLSKGANVNQRTAKGWTALHYAADNNSLKLVNELLLAPGIVVDATTNLLETPIHLAARQGHLEQVLRLAVRGANLEFRTAARESPHDLGKLAGIPRWEERVTPGGRIYYVDHYLQKTSFNRPA